MVPGGAMLGGATKGVKALTSKPKITYYIFDRTKNATLNAIHPIAGLGHIGASFDDGKKVLGFMLDTSGLSMDEAKRAILGRKSLPGVLKDQTKMFADLGSAGMEIVKHEEEVGFIKYTIAKRRALKDLKLGSKSGKKYSLPQRDGSFSKDTYNCATYLDFLGIPNPIGGPYIGKYFGR